MNKPSIEQLAAIAAQLAGRTGSNMETAANEAAALWKQCCAIVADWDGEPTEQKKEQEGEQNLLEEAEALDRHESIAFDDLLAGLPPDKLPADERLARFRDFLAEFQGIDQSKIGPTIEGFKTAKLEHFRAALIKVEYRKWWSARLSKTNTVNANKNNEKSS